MTITVLAVDASRTMRNMIDLALKEEDFDVHMAEDGMDGLDVLEGLNPDVIITDINMPRLDGFGFIDAVREREETRHTPILVLTTESSPDLKARARDRGATGWIVEPFAQDKLIRALRMVAG